MDISSKERLYFDKYLHNLRQGEVGVTPLPASLGAVLQNTPKPFFFFPPLPKSKQTDATFLPVELTRHVPPFFWVTPAPYTCSSVSGRTSADVTHGWVICSPLCQVPSKKEHKKQSVVSDLVPTYTHRQTTLHPTCCELLDNQAGRKSDETVFCFIFIKKRCFYFFFKYVLLVKSGLSRIF